MIAPDERLVRVGGCGCVLVIASAAYRDVTLAVAAYGGTPGQWQVMNVTEAARLALRPCPAASASPQTDEERPPACGVCGGCGYLVSQSYERFTADVMPDNWVPVQRCDACSVFDGDEDAARAYAATVPGATVRYFQGVDSDGYDLGDWAVDARVLNGPPL